MSPELDPHNEEYDKNEARPQAPFQIKGTVPATDRFLPHSFSIYLPLAAG